MKFEWLLIPVLLRFSEGSRGNNEFISKTKTVKMRNQNTDGRKFNCLGLHCNVLRFQREQKAAKTVKLTTARATSGQNREGTKETLKLLKLAEGRKETTKGSLAEGKEKNISGIGMFLKLVTRGLLKNIALPAIVRLSLVKGGQEARTVEKMNQMTRVQ